MEDDDRKSFKRARATTLEDKDQVIRFQIVWEDDHTDASIFQDVAAHLLKKYSPVLATMISKTWVDAKSNDSKSFVLVIKSPDPHATMQFLRALEVTEKLGSQEFKEIQVLLDSKHGASAMPVKIDTNPRINMDAEYSKKVLDQAAYYQAINVALVIAESVENKCMNTIDKHDMRALKVNDERKGNTDFRKGVIKVLNFVAAVETSRIVDLPEFSEKFHWRCHVRWVIQWAYVNLFLMQGHDQETFEKIFSVENKTGRLAQLFVEHSFP